MCTLCKQYFLRPKSYTFKSLKKGKTCLPFFIRLYGPTTCADRIRESTDRQDKVECTDKKLRVRLRLEPGTLSPTDRRVFSNCRLFLVMKRISLHV